MGCSRADRRAEKKPSVEAGCGYKANVSSGKVTIYPTVNNSNCYIEKIGLGDATFTFDPKNPPDTIKRVITKDSDGEYIPQITPVPTRSVKLFSSVETVDESFTDADGNTTAVTMPKLIDFKIDGYTAGVYQATGIKNTSRHSGRTMGMQGSSRFTGAIPYDISIDAIQLFTYEYGYAYLDTDGYVNVVQKGSSVNTRFNMGSEVADPYVMEFTVKSDNKTFICKNIDNYAVEVYAPFSYGNNFTHKSVIDGVIRVASGQILKQAKTGAIVKSVLTSDGYAVAIGENDVVDIMPDGNGGVTKIRLSDVSNIVNRVGSYSINTDNNLLYNGNVIASDIIGIGSFAQHKPQGLMLGKAGKETNIVKKSAHNVFSRAGVQESWKNAYDNWYSAQKLPSCGWAGVGETSTTVSSFLLCMKQSNTPNSSVPQSILVIDVNGDYFKVTESTLTKQVLVDTDDKGFNAINTVNQGGKFIAFQRYSGSEFIKKFHFSTPETSYNQDNYLFRY